VAAAFADGRIAGGTIVNSSQNRQVWLPAMRGWITDRNNYAPPVEIGDTMGAFAAGVVIESRNAAYAIGDRLRRRH
jgi:NADPH-dependent curcumin reductase CurA